MNKTVVLLSGGVDSMVCAYLALSHGCLAGCVFVDYGQPVRYEESLTAVRWCAKNDIPFFHIEMELHGLEEMDAPSGEPGNRIIPGRNGALIAAAVNVAASIEAEQVWIGCTAEDRAYPDCNHGFLVALNNAYTLSEGVSVKAPFLYHTRAMILKDAKERGWDLSEAWSCYKADENGEQCGKCNSCRQ